MISIAENHLEIIGIKHFLTKKTDNIFHIIDQIKVSRIQ